jgi:hypothetical protein
MPRWIISHLYLSLLRSLAALLASLQSASDVDCRCLAMAQQTEPKLYVCADCYRYVPLQLCKSDKNGNSGRMFAKCEMKQPDGSVCKYFRWATPKSSPATSLAPSPILSYAPPPQW